MWMPSAVNTASNAWEFAVAVAEQEPQPGCASVEVHQQVPRLLDDPGAARMGGHPDDVHLAGRDLEEEQHVDPFEQHGVDGQEVTGQHRFLLGRQELFPGRPDRRGAGSIPAWWRIFHTVLAATW